MYNTIKHIKPFAVLVVVGLFSTQIITLVSKYCFCEAEKPQIEILSITECNHEEGCESGHQYCNKNVEHLKMSHKNCTYSFIEQLIYTEQKNVWIQNIASINFYVDFYIDFYDEPREYSLLFGFAKTDIRLPHNRFIDIINRVQLLI